MTSAEYSDDNKEKLMRRISKLRSKKNLIQIRDIIVKHNPNIKITQNSNGLFLDFENLTYDTYEDLDKYINQLIEASRLKRENTTISSDKITNNPDEFPYETDAKLRLSNKEKHLLKKAQYEKELNDISESYTLSCNTPGKDSPSHDSPPNNMPEPANNPKVFIK